MKIGFSSSYQPFGGFCTVGKEEFHQGGIISGIMNDFSSSSESSVTAEEFSRQLRSLSDKIAENTPKEARLYIDYQKGQLGVYAHEEDGDKYIASVSIRNTNDLLSRFKILSRKLIYITKKYYENPNTKKKPREYKLNINTPTRIEATPILDYFL